MTEALVLINPESRRGDEAEPAAIAAALSARGVAVAAAAHVKAGDIARTIERHEAATVIVGGGDGTLNAALPALAGAPRALGVLPLGTANDLARGLGIPDGLEAALDLVAADQRRRIDVGDANGQLFLNAAGVGLGPRLTGELDARAKSRWGVFAYLFAALRAWRRTRPFRAEIYCDGAAHGVRSLQITIANGKYYGGGMSSHAEATLDDGRLDLIALRQQSFWRLLASARALRTGEVDPLREVLHLRGREMELRTRRRRRVTTDGEFTTETPLTVTVRAGALEVFAPPERANAA